MGRGLVLAGMRALSALVSAAADAPVSPRIDVAEAAKLVAAKQAVVIDTRSPERYRMLHIPGAINVPLGQEKSWADQLKKETRTIITYCTCSEEQTALASARSFDGLGVKNVRALRGGLGEWQKQGQPLE